MNRIEIPLSHKKLVLGILGSIMFVILGLYFISSIDGQRSRFNPAFTIGVGIVAIVFFSATGIYGIKKLFDKNIGLIIDDMGITDNTNASSIGLIRWTDITGFTTGQVMSTKFLLIFTHDPAGYLEKSTGMKRKLMQGNMKMYGTPLSITSSTLKFDFKELERLITERWHEKRKPMSDTTSD